MDRDIIEEIVLKEEEKYRLKSVGLMYDTARTIRRLCDAVASGEIGAEAVTGNLSFAAMRELVIDYLYVRVLSYASFIDGNRRCNPRLEYSFAVISKRHIASLSRRQKALLDAELKTGDSLTVAYHPADTIIERLHQLFSDSGNRFEKPDDVKDFYFRNIEAIYPIILSVYIGHLESGDRSFWEVTCRYIKNLTDVAVVCNLAGHCNSDLIGDHAWSDTYDILYRRLAGREGNIPVFGSGKDFRNYIITVCNYRLKNLAVKFSARMGAEMEKMPDMATPEPAGNFDIRDVDPCNAYEVANAISIILLDSGHSYYRQLTEGMESKIEIFMANKVDGMGYNDIARSLYKHDLSPDELKRHAAALRKNSERLIKSLTERMIKLITKNDRNDVTFLKVVR